MYAGNPTNRLHTIHFYRWVSNAVFGDQLAELKDMPSTHKPSVEIVEILNQKPQPKQAGKIADKPTAPKAKEEQLESLAQKTSEAQLTTTAQKVTNTQQAQLPQTGSKENSALFTVATILLATSGGLFLLKKKEA